MEQQRGNICALCRQEKVLCKSHLISKGFYKYIHDTGKTLKISNKGTTVAPGQGQITAYLLCEQCENILSKSEKVVIADAYQKKTAKFPLLEKALNAQNKYSLADPSSFMVFPETNSDINWNTHLIFALSTFWRCSVAKNNKDVKDYYGALGPYQDVIRRMLFPDSSSMPEHMLLSIVINNDNIPLRIIAPPTVKNYTGYHVHEFFVPNMRYCLFIGEKMPESLMYLRKKSGPVLILIKNLLETKYFDGIANMIITSVPLGSAKNYCK